MESGGQIVVVESSTFDHPGSFLGEEEDESSGQEEDDQTGQPGAEAAYSNDEVAAGIYIDDEEDPTEHVSAIAASCQIREQFE